MNDEIQVGDRVRVPNGDRGEVVYIGRGWYVVDVEDGLDLYTPEEVTKLPTFPERWINVYPDARVVSPFATREGADRYANPDRIGVIHLHPDGTVEMEAP